MVCRAAFHSQIEIWGHLQPEDHLMFICAPLQSQSGIIITPLSEFTCLRVPAGGVPIAPQPVVSITSLTLFGLRNWLFMGPMAGKGGTSLHHTSNAC